MIGTKLGHFEILELLGAGGMGEVYRARDSKLGRDVAIKILPAAMASDTDRRARFQQEARAVAALTHPNIVTIHSVDEESGHLFLTMELVEGKTLSDLIPDHGMNVEPFLSVALPLVEAVVAAHQRGITHRDLKPGNVMLGKDGQLKVLDFGLAKLLEVDPAQAETMAVPATGEGRILGTVAYMSPEQAEGKPVDPRSDIFSLGVILFEMATGNRPFKGDTNISTITSILRDEPPSVTELRQNLPKHLGRIIRRCLAKTPERRYQSSVDLRNDLQGLREEITSGDIEAPAIAARPASRGIPRSVMLILGAVALGAVVFAVLRFLPGRSGTPAPPSGQAMHMTRLTNTGKSIEAAISPDGKMVTHVVVDKGGSSLWMTQASTASSVEILPASDADIWDPVFDPAGEFLYYVQQERGADIPNLLRIPALGGTPRKILDNVGQTISFSPDGTQFAFTRQEPSTPKTMIGIANTDGSGERILATKEAPESFNENPAWSPDGKLIAAPVQSLRTGIEAYVVGLPVDGGEERRLSTQTWLDLTEIAWLPDMKGLVLAASEDFVGSQLWELAYPGGTARRITNDVNTYNGVSLTADGRVLAAGLDESSYCLQIIAGDGSGEPRALTAGRNRSDGIGLSWAPDGRILYGSASDEGLGIWSIGENGGSPLKVIQESSIGPAVSPDGRTMAYMAAQGGIHIWKANLDGSGRVQLTHGQSEFSPVWSADGGSVVYIGGQAGQIFKIPAEGGEPVLLSPLPGVFGATVSPDGDRIAFRAWDSGKGKIRTFIIPGDGGEPVAVLDIPSGNHQWSPDGRAIAYVDDHDGVGNLWSQPLAGGAARQITRFQKDEISAFAWSRDGKRIAVSRGETTSDVVLITDFR